MKGYATHNTKLNDNASDFHQWVVYSRNAWHILQSRPHDEQFSIPYVVSCVEQIVCLACIFDQVLKQEARCNDGNPFEFLAVLDGNHAACTQHIMWFG
jgi:hypothetical protein